MKRINDGWVLSFFVSLFLVGHDFLWSNIWFALLQHSGNWGDWLLLDRCHWCTCQARCTGTGWRDCHRSWFLLITRVTYYKSDSVLLWYLSALLKNVDYLLIAKPIIAINYLEIHRDCACVFHRWLLVVFIEDLWSLSFHGLGDHVWNLWDRGSRHLSGCDLLGCEYPLQGNVDLQVVQFKLNHLLWRTQAVGKGIHLPRYHGAIDSFSGGSSSPFSSYLVDPASSHMLVSKIKPCMSKYKQICTVKLRMAH